MQPPSGSKQFAPTRRAMRRINRNSARRREQFGDFLVWPVPFSFTRQIAVLLHARNCCSSLP